MKRICFTVGQDVLPGTRIDKYLVGQEGLGTRSQLKTSLKEITLNGKPVKASKPVRPGDLLEITVCEPEAPRYEAREIPLDIIYEDSRVVVINKPRGMVVHPGSGEHSATLVQGLLYHVQNLAENFSSEKIRPGIIHRLDKDTSGIIIAAKDPEAHEYLSNQFRSRFVKKRYLAIVQGRLPEARGLVTGFIKRDPRHRKRFTVSAGSGRQAETRYRVLAECEGYTFVRLTPKTGRTHQLRVHMKSLGCPILGDPIYGRKDERFPLSPLMLHSRRLTLTLPGETQKRSFTAPLPPDFADMRKSLFLLSDTDQD